MKLKLKITNNIHFTKNVVTQLNSASDKFASSTDAITAALAKEITSISSVRQNNTQLSLRNELNLATVEGQTALAGINVKLDENAFIKENVSSYEQQKIAIGDYKTKSRGIQGINLFNGGIGGFVARAQAGGAGNLLTTSLKGISGVYGMVKASLVFCNTSWCCNRFISISCWCSGGCIQIYDSFT
jgi:hypothetical protein